MHMSARLPRQVLCLVCPCSLIELGPGCLPHLAHDVPHVGVVHGVARYRSRVAIEDVHQVSLLAVLQNQVKLVHLPAHRPNASEKKIRERRRQLFLLFQEGESESRSLHFTSRGTCTHGLGSNPTSKAWYLFLMTTMRQEGAPVPLKIEFSRASAGNSLCLAFLLGETVPRPQPRTSNNNNQN